jgi:drug/metabolite transporter (DMT)-like permease
MSNYGKKSALDNNSKELRTMNNSESSSKIFEILCSPFGSNFLFCFTGVVQVILYQWLDYHGIEGGKTGVGVLASYLGLLFCALPFLFDERDRRPRFHKMFVPTVFCDIAGQVCAQLAIELCGSGLFMVIYSSITVFAALFRWYFYDKKLLCKQWVGIVIITLGLCITALGGKDVLEGDGAPTSIVNDSGRTGVTQQHSITTSVAPSLHSAKVNKVANIVTGMTFALFAAIFYAWVYVWTEQLMKGNFSKSTNNLAPSPMGLAAFSGFIGTAVTSIYIMIFIGPHWDTLIIEPARLEKSSYNSLMFAYVILLIACGLHNTSIVYVGKSGGGAVATGVNKAIQTISVFIVSAIAFGQVHHEQQFSFEKGLGVLFVIGGVLFYSFASVNKGKDSDLFVTDTLNNRNRNFDDDGGADGDNTHNGSAGSIHNGVELQRMKNSDSLSSRVINKIAQAMPRNNVKKAKYSIISTREDEDGIV